MADDDDSRPTNDTQDETEQLGLPPLSSQIEPGEDKVVEDNEPTIPSSSVVIVEKDETDQELIRLALHKSPFFTCLDDEQVERFIQVAQLKRYTGGQTIILEGCVDEFGNDDETLAESSSTTLPDQQQPQQQPQQLELKIPEANQETTKVIPAEEEEEENGTESITEEGFILVEKPDSASLEQQSEEDQGKADKIEKSLALSEDMPDASLVASSDNVVEANNPIHVQPAESNEDESQQPLLAMDQGRSSREVIDKKYKSPKDDPNSSHYLEPPPAKSGVPSYIYIIRNGQADVMYSKNVNPASLGTGTVFGEGGFLFGRQHSASVLAASDLLECFVVDATTFRNFVLPSEHMKKLYQMHAAHVDENTSTPYMTMQDFVNSCLDSSSSSSPQDDSSSSESKDDSKNHAALDTGADEVKGPIQDPLATVRIANTFNILRNDQAQGSTTFSHRISLADFCLFHLLMARPDPEVDITFLLIDEHKRGVLHKEDIANFLKSSLDDDFVFDVDSDFIHRHFGKDNDHSPRSIRPNQFSQFLVDLRREIGQQVFLQEVERHGTPEGYLSPSNFVRVLKKACGWRLPGGVADRLESIYQTDESTDVSGTDNHHGTSSSEGSTITTNRPRGASQNIPGSLEGSSGLIVTSVRSNEKRLGAHHFTFCDFLAFQEVFSQLPGICNVIDRACEIKKGPVSADDFKVANRVLGMGGSLSRRQVDIIFQLFDLDGDGYVSQEDTVAVAGVEVAQRLDAVPGRRGSLTFAPPPKYRHSAQAEESKMESFWVLLQNFSLTSLAGAIGVVALAPLDLAKTRLMNDRVAIDGQRMYKNSFDCLQLALRSEGILGLYRGLLPQLIGVAPEKAIKLAVNDLLIQSLGIHDSSTQSGLRYLQEMLAGGCAGACQLLVSNPIEIVKIRMQLQGETARLLKARGFDNPIPQSLQAVARTLGYSGLFTGARACLLRDIPFGAIYFPTYTLLKEMLSNREGQPNTMSAANLLVAGTLASVPASLLTTPADVIKTRLQVIPRPGEQTYDGIRDCFTKVYQREGPTAFFKGAAARVARISPQFGISLVAYEQLSKLLGAKGFLPPTAVPVTPQDYYEAFPVRALHGKTDDADQLLRKLGTKSLGPGGPWNERA